jgi:hypothetical protein
VRLPVRRPVLRAFRVLHVVSAGAWVGIDVVLGVLVVTALLDRSAAATVLPVLPLLPGPLLVTGLVCLASGLALGTATRYGVVRYWWGLVKLVINVVLVVLVALVLRDGLGRAAATGADGPVPAGLLFPPAVSISALLLASVLGLVKPWGRVRPPA